MIFSGSLQCHVINVSTKLLITCYSDSVRVDSFLMRFEVLFSVGWDARDVSCRVSGPDFLVSVECTDQFKERSFGHNQTTERVV